MAQQYTAVMFTLQQGCGSYSNDYERRMAQQYTAVMFTLQQECGSYISVMKGEWHSSTQL